MTAMYAGKSSGATTLFLHELDSTQKRTLVCGSPGPSPCDAKITPCPIQMQFLAQR